MSSGHPSRHSERMKGGAAKYQLSNFPAAPPPPPTHPDRGSCYHGIAGLLCRSQDNIKDFFFLKSFLKRTSQLNQKLAGRLGPKTSKEDLQTTTYSRLSTSEALPWEGYVSEFTDSWLWLRSPKREETKKNKRKQTTIRIF